MSAVPSRRLLLAGTVLGLGVMLLPAQPAQAPLKVVKTPLRAWADLLIAVWLVLVASAVIASLLWRR